MSGRVEWVLELPFLVASSALGTLQFLIYLQVFKGGLLSPSLHFHLQPTISRVPLSSPPPLGPVTHAHLIRPEAEAETGRWPQAKAMRFFINVNEKISCSSHSFRWRKVQGPKDPSLRGLIKTQNND